MKRDHANFYKTSRFDFIFIGLILAISLTSIAWVMYSRFEQAAKPKVALMHLKDKPVERIVLQRDQTLPILDGKMQIEVKNGRVRVAKSDCPQHICMNMGWIQYNGQTIVCVPNNVLIEVQSADSSFLDVVAY